MAFRHHLSALLYKNWLIWKRNLASSMCELFLPLGLFMVLLYLRFQFPAKDVDGKSYVYPNNLSERVE
jgi:hypothetical protein